MTPRKECLPNRTGCMDLWTHSDHGNTYKGPAQVWTRFSSSSKRNKWTWIPAHYQKLNATDNSISKPIRHLKINIIYETFKII